MIVVVPSIVVGIFVYELGIILEFAGVFSLIISGVLIPLMAIAAQKIIPEKSKYDFKDNYWVALMLIGTSVTIFMICMIFLVIYQVDNS